MKVKAQSIAKPPQLLQGKSSPLQKKQSASRVRQGKANVRLQGNAAARRLLHKWLADESGYEEDTWPLLKNALEENRSPPQRKLFRD